MSFPLSVPTPRPYLPSEWVGLAGALLLALGAQSAANAANPAGVGAQAATAAAKQFKVADGLAISLFAAEPFVRNPANMDIDERGRVWVTEGVNYRSSFQKWGTLDPAGDRIVILEDTDGDGTADKQTVFYQDPSINTALGICVLGNKVIVSDSPNVFVLTDNDGDGRADQRELLFTGIAGVDHDHGVHAFVFGPDGKLYFNMGNEGQRLGRPLTRELPLHGVVAKAPMEPVVDLDGHAVVADGKPYRMGMVFRCNLDGSDVETLAWNFRNNYEVAVDSFGTLWQSDNDDDGNRGVRINYVMEHGNFGYSEEITGAGWPVAWQSAKSRGVPEDQKPYYEWHQEDPGVVPNLLQTGAGSPTGIAVYEGKLLPDIFRNQMLHCDAGPRVVRSYPVLTLGAGYTAQITNLATTSDSWFRPSDVCVAPDGSVFVADWNDAGVGGHYMADQKLDTMTGRIYRIAPIGNKLSVPKLKLDTAAGCVEALRSPNLATRYLAWTRLHALQGGAERELQRLWQDGDPRLRARALHLLARIPGKAQSYLAAAVKDKVPDIRITGLRLSRELKQDLVPIVKQLARDSSVQVRRECALSLRHSGSSEAPRLWATLAAQHNAGDRWYLEALGIGADGNWDRSLDAWLETTGGRPTNAAAREIVWRSRASKTPALLTGIVTDPNLDSSQRSHYFRAYDFVSGQEKEAALLSLLDKANADLTAEALTRLKGIDLEANPTVKKSLFHMLEETRGTPRFVELVRDFRIKGQEPALLEMAVRDPNGSTGVEALRLVLRTGSSEAINQALAGTNRSAVVMALGNASDKQSVSLLEGVLMSTNRDAALGRTAVHSLARTREGTESLLRRAEDSSLPADVRLATSSELSLVRWTDLRARAANVLPLPTTQNAQPLPPLSELAARKGDAGRGAAVFRRESSACLKCHQVNGEGVDFGPNLSEIGTKLGKEALYEAILDPSAGISFGFEAWQLVLSGGNDALGLIISETAEEVSLKAVGGAVTRFKRSEIVSRTKQKLSIMPADVQQTMSSGDLVDLVEYLATLKTASSRAGQGE